MSTLVRSKPAVLNLKEYAELAEAAAQEEQMVSQSLSRCSQAKTDLWAGFL